MLQGELLTPKIILGLVTPVLVTTYISTEQGSNGATAPNGSRNLNKDFLAKRDLLRDTSGDQGTLETPAKTWRSIPRRICQEWNTKVHLVQTLELC